jgi:nucleoside-diphosphate-sugar epimerase
MKIALTGSSGRVGDAIAQAALARGDSLVTIDRVPSATLREGANCRFVEAEMSDYETLVDAFEGCEAVIHMAAIPAPFKHPDHIVHNNNVVGSYNALRAAAEHGITRICQASSVNAIGLSYSRAPRFDYFPIDEAHPNYGEDAYSLSKWICEAQADAFVRRYEDMRIASMRFHWVVPERAIAWRRASETTPQSAKNLWAYTRFDAAADACLKASRRNSLGTRPSISLPPTRRPRNQASNLRLNIFPACRSAAISAATTASSVASRPNGCSAGRISRAPERASRSKSQSFE